MNRECWGFYLSLSLLHKLKARVSHLMRNPPIWPSGSVTSITKKYDCTTSSLHHCRSSRWRSFMANFAWKSTKRYCSGTERLWPLERVRIVDQRKAFVWWSFVRSRFLSSHFLSTLAQDSLFGMTKHSNPSKEESWTSRSSTTTTIYDDAHRNGPLNHIIIYHGRTTT